MILRWCGGTATRVTFETTFKMVHSKVCFNLFPVVYKGNKCMTTRQQHLNLYVVGNSYEVAISAYFGPDGLQKSKMAYFARRIEGKSLLIKGNVLTIE